MTKYLTAQQVMSFHDLLLEEFGGLPGVRDKNLLYSALEAPKASFGGKEMYPSIFEKAAAYLYHLARNHPFNDGNKRTAFIAAQTFMEINHTPIKFKLSLLEQIVVEVAHGKVSKEELVHFFKTGKFQRVLE